MSRSRTAWFWHLIKIDEQDAHLLDEYAISIHQKPSGYTKINARDRRTGKISSLAAVILRPPVGLVVDHINRDGFDNRRRNLRVVSVAVNNHNRVMPRTKTDYRGVHIHHSKFRACVWKDGQRLKIGRFDTQIEAARAYDEHALRLYGPDALINFPERAA